jgi:hypothetical protein
MILGSTWPLTEMSTRNLPGGKGRSGRKADNFTAICGVQLGPLGTVATNRPILPAPGVYNDVEIGRMIGRGNRSTRRKPAPVPLCPPQTPQAARMRTRAAAVRSQRLTYVLIFLVVSFLLAFPTMYYMHSSSPTFVLHALPISSSLT